jgi:hypothetical protein
MEHNISSPWGAEVRIDIPAILAKYTGTSGNTHGDKKESIPATKATGKVIFNIQTSPNYPIVVPSCQIALLPTSQGISRSEKQLLLIKIKVLYTTIKSSETSHL